MKQNVENARNAELQDKPTDIMLMENPLDFIAEDHLRVKHVAETMQRIAMDASPSQEDLHEVKSFLENELPLLMHDEDDDLIVLLQPRVAIEDAFAKLTTKLALVHKAMEDDRRNILARLKTPSVEGDDLSAADRSQIMRAATRLTHDMILENAKLLPLAQKRLTSEDIDTLRSRMVQRRISDMRGARDNAR